MNVYGTWLAIAALCAFASCFQTDPIELGADADSGADTQSPEHEAVIEPDVTTDTPPGPAICVSATPEGLQFGEVLVGQSTSSPVVVHNCGELTVRLFEIALEAESSSAFSIGTPYRVTLDPGASHTLMMAYSPTTSPGLDEGVLRLSYGSGVLRVPLVGSAVGSTVGTIDEDVCPTATIVVAEGTSVIPQTVLHLSAVLTEHARGEVDYTWELSQPSGSTAILLPSSTAPEVSMEANVAGPYVVRLTAHDSLAEVSCAPVEIEVHVRPTAALHVELLWHAEPEPPPDLEATGARFVVTTTSDTPVAIDPRSSDGLIQGVPGAAVALESPPQWGSVELDDGGFVYTPMEGFAGSDRFFFQSANGLGVVSVYVSAPGNTQPDARDDRVTTPVDVGFDTGIAVANDIDADGDRVTFGLMIDWPDHGQIVVTNDGPNQLSRLSVAKKAKLTWGAWGTAPLQ